ncbi:MAG: D-2-hydroxyacid dehydrogenase [Planctomycetia bacterium]|nr:D-2-hydroxyacid dehydrogenase [Planctomycetia bacterium]
MKIVVLDGRTLAADGNSWEGLRACGDVELHDRSTPEEVIARAQAADVVITNKAVVSSAAIQCAPRLQLIAVSATGYDCVDVAAARLRGIAVANVPEYGTASVAQYVFALLLHLCHRVGLHADAVQAGEWTKSPDFCFWRTPQQELAGKTLGIVGFGRIGQRVADLGRACGMEVLIHARQRPRGPLPTVSLDELFARADVITLHCPLTPATNGLVHRERLQRVKPTAILINTARGGLVVEADLADALNRGQLAAAAVDVVSREPIRADNPLLTAKNCIITPHIAWATREARARLLAATIANVANFRAGKPTNLV